MSEQDSKELNLDYQDGRPAVREAHDAVHREKPDPIAGSGNRILISRVIVGGIILAAASMYFTAYSNSFDRSDTFLYPGYVAAPRPSIDGGAGAKDDRPWIDVWMADGKKVYNNCFVCHQAEGQGLPGQFPPLKDSEWVNGGTERLGMIMLSGVSGSLTVNGSTYNGLMPAWSTLSDEKIAQVLTYVRRSFGELPEGKSGVVTTEMMQAAREKHGGRTLPWTEADLQAVPGDADLPGDDVDLNTGKPGGEKLEEESSAN